MKATYEMLHEVNDDGVISHRILETGSTLLEIIESTYKYSMEDRKIAFILCWTDDSTVPRVIPYGNFFIHFDKFEDQLMMLRRGYPNPDLSDEERAELNYIIR